MCSVEEEISWVSLGGDVHDLSEHSSEKMEVSGSEGLKSISDILSDGYTVHDDVLTDGGHMVLWIFKGLNDVIEVSPVLWGRDNSLANWERLLELCEESNGSDDSTDGLIDVLIMISLIEDLNSLV